MVKPKDRLIVALDVPSRDRALKTIEQLEGLVSTFKIGLELFTAVGPEFVKEMTARGVAIFLDLKFHDIPNTVAGACASAARLGVKMLNVHASGGAEMMRAAIRGVDQQASGSGRPLVLGVTVLTSLDGQTLQSVGVDASPRDQVVRLARLSHEAGLDGVVASPNEITAVRQAVPPRDFIVVTPGVRPAWAELGDQKRVATPSQAIKDGADFLVIGRPITGHASPRDAAERVLLEIAGESGY